VKLIHEEKLVATPSVEAALKGRTKAERFIFLQGA
jgi:hypothetical protein